jgi:hypothetical protein
MGQIPMKPETPVAAPAAPAAQVTPSGLTLEEEQELNSIFSQTAAAKAKKKDEGLSASDYKDDEKFTDDLSYSDPDIRKVTNELEELKSREEALKTIIDKSKIGATPDQEAQYAAAVLERSKKQTEVDRSKANFRTAVRIAGGPEKYLAIKLEQEKAAREEALKAQSTPAAPAAAAPAAGAGTTAATPKPPVELNFFEKALLEEAPAKKKEFEESGNQWTSAKQSIRGALGAGENGLEKIALEVFKADILGKGLPFVRARLIERIANEVGGRIPQGTKNAPIKFGLTDKAFSQKSERLGPQAVTWYEVVGAMADDLISQYEKAQKGANAAAATPALITPPVSGVKGELIPQ